jgi:hypothetical protein
MRVRLVEHALATGLVGVADPAGPSKGSGKGRGKGNKGTISLVDLCKETKTAIDLEEHTVTDITSDRFNEVTTTEMVAPITLPPQGSSPGIPPETRSGIPPEGSPQGSFPWIPPPTGIPPGTPRPPENPPQ